MPESTEMRPLVTQEHCDCLDQCLERCELLDLAIAKAREAGYNVDVQAAIVAEQRRDAARAKRALFPDRI